MIMLIVIPKGYYGRIVGGSGLANTRGIIGHDRTIDSDYRGIMCVVLFNLSDQKYLVETGNRVAQLIIERCFTPKFLEVNTFMEILALQVFDILGISIMSCEE